MIKVLTTVFLIFFVVLVSQMYTGHSARSNCFKVHPDSAAGPCIYCGQDDPSRRYIHLIQRKIESPEFCNFVIKNYNIAESSCVCRKCEIKFRRLFSRSLNVDTCKFDSPANKKTCSDEVNFVQNEKICYYSNFSTCNEAGDHITTIDLSLFQKAFNIDAPENSANRLENVKGRLCHKHYNKLYNTRTEHECVICETSSRYKRYILIPDQNHELLKHYLKHELHFENDFISSNNIHCCVYCYNGFNLFCRSDYGDETKYKTSQYLLDIQMQNKNEPLTINNLEVYSLQEIIDYVIQAFLNEEVLLLPVLYDKYKSFLQKNANSVNLNLSDSDFSKLSHNTQWLFRMLKVRLSKSLQVFVPKKKNSGRLLYRNGSDLLNALHSNIVEHHNSITKMETEIAVLTEKNSALISEKNKPIDKHVILEEAISLLRPLVKSYVSEMMKSTEFQDISKFDPIFELKQIPPFLWNFIFRLSASDTEEKEWKRVMKSWNYHFIEQKFNFRIFPRLYISSCIFNTQNSQCVQPLHLLMTDVFDKFSNSSSLFLSINARLGAGISKDSLKRFIVNRCKVLEEKQRFISCDRFSIASFDNLDKNQSYSIVGAGRDKSGFHGTTIQTVTPRSSLITDNLISDCISNTAVDVTEIFTEVKSTRERTVSSDLVMPIINPENKIGPPSLDKQNKFSYLSISDFEISASELTSWQYFCNQICRYAITKTLLQEKKIVVPGIKTFFSIPVQETEKSTFTSVAVLDETADNKETVLKVLNILHTKFQVDISCDYVVVVGDGKSYDHIVKLKTEHGSTLDWVLPYPGDWHILKNLLPIFVKLYFDAGLKELATKFHRGSTYRVLSECSKFSVTHRFLIEAWEAILRHQVHSFLSYISGDFKTFQENFDKVIMEIFSSLDMTDNGNEICDSSLFTEICSKRNEIFSVFTGDLLEKFNNWRSEQRLCSDTFAFWDCFLHTDLMSYLGFYISIRNRNWELRNASLKKLVCLFHAFDKHNYLRLIPYHLADLKTFPPAVLNFFSQGCFAVSISGDDFYSVALDEAHEMVINLKTKNALNSFSKANLTALTYYLPYRAETIYNLKYQLNLSESTDQKQTTVPLVKTGESNIEEYMLKLKTSSLFISDSRKTLHHIFSDIDATKEQTDSLMNYRQYGQQDFINYLNCFLLKSSDLNSKPPPRRRRNLTTFSGVKTTVHKQKKELQDQKTVITCLRKKIAFSKLTNTPILDLEQFLLLPRAICDAEGIPEKGQKSWASSVFKNLYPNIFLQKVPVTSPAIHTSYIIDGMFIINCYPLPAHTSFGDYVEYLFNRWIVHSHHFFNAGEIHLIFDHPNRQGLSPKDVERTRRDSSFQEAILLDLSPDTPLPSNWRTFISVRQQKRLLVNFISEQFLVLANRIFSDGECFFVTAGGFDGQFKDQARCAFNNNIAEYPLGFGNHEEADTRLWLHAVLSSAKQIIIYSPDTDIYFIGLPLIKSIHKTVYVQLKDTSFEKTFIDMNQFISCLENDICFQGISNIDNCIQFVYILSGCDYVSYFKGYGKKSFFDVFRKYAIFVTGSAENGLLHDIDNDNSLYSFYRLISSVYFAKHSSAFQPFTCPKSLFDSFHSDDINTKHTSLISAIREKLWERVQTETEILPNVDALKLHWLRCCWVFKFWKQASNNILLLPSLTDYGWSVSNDSLKFIWDTEINYQKQEETINWYKKGCACKTGCLTNRCVCRKSKSGKCGPGCKCVNCLNLPNLSLDLENNNLVEENTEYLISELDGVQFDEADDVDDNNQEDDFNYTVDFNDADVISYWETMNEIDV